jgi:mRNA interferase YafQ
VLAPGKTTQFIRDQKKAVKQKKDIKALNEVLKQLIEENSLDPKHKDHPLIGNWKGCRDCHIQNDWVLIYRINRKKGTIIFERIGSHAELFG